LVDVPLSKIYDNPYQPRANYDAEHILNLAVSIKALKGELVATRGLQQTPTARLITIRQKRLVDRAFYADAHAMLVRDDLGVQLMFGHSRLRAFMVLAEGLRALGDGSAIGLNFIGVSELATRYADLLDPDSDYATMPMFLGFALDHAMWAHAITENSQRKNITAMEEARTMQRAIDEFGLTTEQAGQPFGYQRSTTANKLRLLNLPPEVQTAIDRGDLSERHGRELLRLADDPVRVRLAAQNAIDKGQTVRQLTENVNWREQEMKQAQAKARQLEAVRAAIRAGWRVAGGAAVSPGCVKEVESYKVNIFDSSDPADRVLVEQGVCGPQCACFALAYSERRAERGYRPDAEKAPNVCMACLDYSAHMAKRRALGEIEDTRDEARAQREAAAEKKRQREAMNNEAHDVWQRWLKEQDRHALWNSIEFWKVAFAGGPGGIPRTSDAIKAATSVQGACVEVLKAMYQGTRKYDNALGDWVHTVAAVQGLIESLDSVSRETGGIAKVVKEEDRQ